MDGMPEPRIQCSGLVYTSVYTIFNYRLHIHDCTRHVRLIHTHTLYTVYVSGRGIILEQRTIIISSIYYRWTAYTVRSYPVASDFSETRTSPTVLRVSDDRIQP